MTKKTWGYECVAIFDGRSGGLVRPAAGALWPSKEAARAACKSGCAKIRRVLADVLPDGALTYATETERTRH